jgi:hypothetical protein
MACYLNHYGNKLSPDAGIRLMDELVHLLMSVDHPEEWQEDKEIICLKTEVKP